MSNVAENQKQLSKYMRSVKKAKENAEPLLERISYIVGVIYKTYKRKKPNYWFPDAAQGESGTIESAVAYTDNFLSIDCDNLWEFDYMDKKYDLYDIKDGFPIQWLWMDFETELKEGKRRAEEYAKQEEKEEDAEIAARDEAKKKAKSKLTKKEREILGLT